MSSIGSNGHRATGLLEAFGFSCFRAILPPEEFEAAAQQTGCSPKRKRVLPPEVVAWLMMLVALNVESMTQGLIRAWGWVRHLSSRPAAQVSEEAFCQARRQLKLRFWRILWDRLVTRYVRRFDRRMLWKARFRVLAVDGSEVDLPNTPEVVRFFGRPKNDKGSSKTPQGRLVALCSVFTGFCVGFKFLSLRFTEHTALQHLIRCLRKDDLLVLDRGFFSLRCGLANPAMPGSLPHADLSTGRWISPGPRNAWTR